MSLQKPTIVLFDMDGTTVRHVNPFFLSVLENLDDLLYKITRLISRRKKITDFSEDPAAPRGLLVHRALHKFRRKSVDQIVQPCPGIFLLLNLFKSQNIPMGIVSNGLGAGYGHDVLKTFKLAPYFEAKIFREDIQMSKPHPDPILRALKAMDHDVSTGDVIWYIGDRPKDIIAAMAADKLSVCKIVPFAYGLHAAVTVLRNNIGSDHIVMSYADFFQKIKHTVRGARKKGAPVLVDAPSPEIHKSTDDDQRDAQRDNQRSNSKSAS